MRKQKLYAQPQKVLQLGYAKGQFFVEIMYSKIFAALKHRTLYIYSENRSHLSKNIKNSIIEYTEQNHRRAILNINNTIQIMWRAYAHTRAHMHARMHTYIGTHVSACARYFLRVHSWIRLWIRVSIWSVARNIAHGWKIPLYHTSTLVHYIYKSKYLSVRIILW